MIPKLDSSGGTRGDSTLTWGSQYLYGRKGEDVLERDMIDDWNAGGSRMIEC